MEEDHALQTAEDKKPRKRDALFLSNNEGSFSFGFGGDVLDGQQQNQQNDAEEAEEARKQLMSSDNDDDDEDDDDAGGGNDDDDDAKKVRVVKQKQPQQPKVKTFLPLDQVLKARKDCSNIGVNFFGLTNLMSSSNTKKQDEDDANKHQQVQQQQRQRKAITRENHSRNVQYLFDKIRQEAAVKLYDAQQQKNRNAKTTGDSAEESDYDEYED